MKRFAAATIATVSLTACGSATSREPAEGQDDGAAVIASVRDALETDRIAGAEFDGSRLSVRLRSAASPGDEAISLWYGKLLAQEVVNRVGTKVSSADYSPSRSNGGPDRRLHPSTPPDPLAPEACHRVAETYTAADVTDVRRLDVLGGACAFVVRPADAERFVADAGFELSPLRDLPGGPNARPTLIEVVDEGGTLRFVLWWVPRFGGGIGQGAAWVQPGWRSSAVVSQVELIPS